MIFSSKGLKLGTFSKSLLCKAQDIHTISKRKCPNFPDGFLVMVRALCLSEDWHGSPVTHSP